MKKISLKRILIFLVVILSIIAVEKEFGVKAEAKGKGSYYIKVNKSTNVVTVYNNSGKAKKAFLCSAGHATPIGTFYSSGKYRWKELMGPSYGQYCTRITRSFLFHSVWYYQSGNYASQSTVQYNKLGRLASHGCVRLTCADAKWIYDNCPVGTKIIIFNGKSKDDPLGKPKLVKVSTSRKKAWDPTDPNSSNPYRKITIKGISNKTVSKKLNSTYTINKKIKASDKYGTSLTKYIKIYLKKPNGKSNIYKKKTIKLSKSGVYELKYSVTSPYSKVTKKVVVKIKTGKQKASTSTTKTTNNPLEITGVDKDMVVEGNSTKDIKSNVKAKDVDGKSITDKIKISVKKPGDTKETETKDKTLKFSKIGDYYVTYKVTSKVNGKTLSKTVKYTSKDSKKPSINGLSDKTVDLSTNYDVLSGVSAKSAMGTNLTSKIKVKVIDPNNNEIALNNNKFVCSMKGKYTIIYSVTNESNVTKESKITVTVVEETKLEITDNLMKTYSFGDRINLLSCIKATSSSNDDITSQVKVRVFDDSGIEVIINEDGILDAYSKNYTIVYSIIGDNNKTTTISKKITKE